MDGAARGGCLTGASGRTLFSQGRSLQASDAFDADALRRAYEYESHEFSAAAREESTRADDTNMFLAPEQLDSFLDLGPYVNPAPYVVQADTSLTKVFHLFRQLNLRHLCVVPHVNEVVGIITRKASASTD